MKKIAILGSTGSIGVSTLGLLKDHPGWMEVEILSAHHNVDRLLEQIEECHPKVAFLTGTKPSKEQVERAKRASCELVADDRELLKVIANSEVFCVVLAIMGAAGLQYGLEALKKGKRLAIANKEPLVIAGHLFHEAAEKGGGEIIPVDSEHSAIFQCIGEHKKEEIERLILTSSGGPFHYHQESEFNEVTPEQALKHPTWDMGNKITVDSATMMNKALEVIEAKWLFDFPVEDIQVVIHRQSIVHSMVEFVDGSTMAQLGVTNMKHPIHYALAYPERVPCQLPKLDWQSKLDLSFEPINPILNQAIQLARDCSRDDISPILMNAANEIFVAAFLKKKVEFKQVYSVLREVVNLGLKENFKSNSLEDILEVDAYARRMTQQLLGEVYGIT